MDGVGPPAAGICAVIVTYRPDAKLPDRARLIAGQVGAVVVVDNGSGADHDDTLRRLSAVPNLTLLRNRANLGVAAALNQGVEWAKRQGHGWVLLFDQDTVPFDSMVAELGRVYERLRPETSAILLGCNFLDVNTRRTWLNPLNYPNHSWVDAIAVATSGTLLPLATYGVLGPFRDDLFVDLVDLEYGLRARSRGYRVAMTVQPLMLHAVGAKTRRRFLGRTVWPSHHPPLRRYFYARNTVLLVREYGTRDPLWALTATWGLAKSLILVLFFEEGKLSKFAFSARGIVSGLMGRSGSGPA